MEYVNKQNLIHDLSTLKLSIQDYHTIEQFVLNYDTIYIDNDNQVCYNDDVVENHQKKRRLKIMNEGMVK